MLRHAKNSGFTLIELIVVLAIFGILVTLGLPNFNVWTQNAQIRTAAGAIQNGLQLARSEAVRRNAQIRFQLTDTTDNNCALTTTATNWITSFDDPTGACGGAFVNEAFLISDATNNPAPRMIQRRPAAEGSSRVVASANQSVIVFNGLGRADTGAVIDFNPSTGACTAFRCLRVTISTGGQIRMCDPNLPSGDTQAC